MSGMVYRQRQGARLPAGCDPQLIGEELSRVRSEVGAGFGPQAVVEAARDEASALYPAVFDCTPEEAAERHWEEQASYVIRSIVLVYEDGEHIRRQTGAFVNVIERETQEHRYLSILVAMADPEYRPQIIARCLDDLLSVRHKYAEYKEFARVFAAIDATAKKIRAA